MKTIVVTVSTNRVGSKCQSSFEVEDDATDDEIDEFAREQMFEMIEWAWWRKEEP